MFQSHNGAIAAYPVEPTDYYFQVVSIPQWCDCCSSNSATTSPPSKFQSHNGAIAAQPNSFGYILHALFQSHNGAIAASLFLASQRLPPHVSIPQWCDCCQVQVACVSLVRRFQSHNGAIAAGEDLTLAEHVELFQSHNGAIAAVTIKYATLRR